MDIAKRDTKASGIILPACDYLGYYAAKPFLYLPLTPNQITVLWIIIKLAAATVMLLGNYWATIIALFLFQIASILDGVDGIIARYRKHFSLNGIYLDYIGHYVCNSALFLCLAGGLYRNDANPYYLLAASIGVLSMLLSKALTLNPAWYSKPEQRQEVERLLHREHFSIIQDQKAGAVKSFKAKITVLFFDLVRIDNPLNLMFWGIAWGFPGLTLWSYAILLFLEMARRLGLQFWGIHRQEHQRDSENK